MTTKNRFELEQAFKAECKVIDFKLEYSNFIGTEKYGIVSFPDPQIATASMKPRNDRGKTIINISITYIWFHQPKMSESPTIYVHITGFVVCNVA